ncbi:hypothetical protein [Streptomyces sp. NPDC090445]|uniref:hypothetical protein n=1 Tax=Streptomyces sp. NPDC090445 TaxID=3365963 RepID=UPI0038081164
MSGRAAPVPAPIPSPAPAAPAPAPRPPAQRAPAPVPAPAAVPVPAPAAAATRTAAGPGPAAAAAPGAPAAPGRAAPPARLADELARALPVPAPDMPKEELALEGGAPLTPPPAVAAYLERKGPAGGPVRVRLGHTAAGILHLRATDRGPATAAGGAFQPVPLRLPFLLPLRNAGIEPVLAVRVHDGVLQGHASVVVQGTLAGSPRALLDRIETCARTLGWLGVSGLKLPGAENELRGPTLVVQATGMSFTLGGFLTASGGFGIAGDTVTFDAVARGTVSGLGSVEVPVVRGADGALSGSAAVDVALRGFTGQVTAAYAGGAVDVRGTVGYRNDRFDGQVTFVATDPATARELTDSRLAEQVKTAKAVTGEPSPAQAAAAGAPDGAAGPRPGPRVLAGWGTVTVRLADWLGGEALVVIDHRGDVTVVGKIVPRMDKPLFEQKDHVKQLARFEVRTLYGIPLVGNVFLFAGIGLEAVAKIGPATLDRMELTGTWSTKPEVLKDFGLTGTLNVSAFAGLRLKAEGGAGLQLLGHDIKAGVALHALAGVRGYVEATPRIGFREVADPKAGKRGEFFLAGHMEIAAQPFLALGGDLFVELDSPWWSPAPDKRWDWPVGRLEYPLPGEFGIGADVEHVLGSGKVPEVAFGEVKFNPDKFMTDLINDKVPAKSAADEQKKGAWKEPGAPAGAPGAATAPGAPSAAPAKAPAAPSRPTARTAPAAGPAPAPAAARKDPADVPSPAKQTRWLSGLQALGRIAEKSHAHPYEEADLRAELAGVRRTYGFRVLEPELHEGKWHVTAAMSPKAQKLPLIDAAAKGASKGSSKDAAKGTGKGPQEEGGTIRVDRRDPAELPAFRGGRYDELKKPDGLNHPGTEINHIPPHSVTKQVSTLSYGRGPAIQMDRQDHRGRKNPDGNWSSHPRALSTGSWTESKEHRARQLALMEAERFKQAVKLDIKDIKSKFGAKYDGALNEMKPALREEGWW